MANITLNRPLIWLAIVGIILHTAGALLSQDQPDRSPDRPAADIPLISKREAAETAAAFLRQRYGLTHDVETFVVYQSHKTLSGYLQKERLYETYEERFIRSFPLDYYEVEATDRITGNRYYVDVNFTVPHVVAWHQANPETANKAANQKRTAESRKLAERELSRQGYDPADFSYVRQSPVDGAYIFESRTKQIGDARLQVHIAVNGGSITLFRPEFSIPDTYVNWQDEQDDSAARMTWISLGFTLAMTLFAVYHAIKYRKTVSFRNGVLLTVIFSAIYLIHNMNMYPSYKTVYSGRSTEWDALISLFIVNMIVFLMAVSLYMSLLAGKAMWLSRGWNAWPRWDEPSFGGEVLNGMGRGYLLCLFIMGVQQLLFFIGERQFHVWSVNDPADSFFNMLAPGLFPLMAWAAAISEEALYRLFGIALFKRITGNNFVSIVIPGMIWALSHTQYPVYPVYMRFVEVTIIGIIFGYAFLRFGFITAVFAHACMDSILMGLSLTGTNRAADAAAGILYIFVPAVVAIVIAWFHRKRIRRGRSDSDSG